MSTRKLAFILRREPGEVERVWRSAKRFCRDSGVKGDYLRVLKVTLTLLKWPQEKVEAIPNLGDVTEIMPKLKGKVVKTDAHAVYIEIDAETPTLVVYPLWGFVTSS